MFYLNCLVYNKTLLDIQKEENVIKEKKDYRHKPSNNPMFASADNTLDK